MNGLKKKYKAALENWKKLDEETKLSWAKTKTGEGLTGYNAYMKCEIERLESETKQNGL